MTLNRLQDRSVARPVANLGNTCYMNAVLQALSHAPDLMHAISCQPHHPSCRIGQKQDGPENRKQPKGHNSSTTAEDDEDLDHFCILCELENHLDRVHDRKRNDRAVSPGTFVKGFIEHVAPHFRLGVQEDSHEFLRLLIDAMQKSAKQARPNVDKDNPDTRNSSVSSEDVEYPFTLFRGSVESNVTCESCGASSCTIDPIEDIGLEVSPREPDAAQQRPERSFSSSRNSSPTPTQLIDLRSALKSFVSQEKLDSGYKCEKCGKVGSATKQTRLSEIPPILTLQLKRFRYGEIRTVGVSRRTRNESIESYSTGKSGSTKIEGHVKFDQVFDLTPYMVQSRQDKNRICRLFAVIVHAGKNSHSGHYIAYVRSLSENTWWKMDDNKITPASAKVVQSADAYMLFYRVVSHEIGLKLEEQCKGMVGNEKSDVRQDTAAITEHSTTIPLVKADIRIPPKRKLDEYMDGGEWVEDRTNLSEEGIKSVRDMEALLIKRANLPKETLERMVDRTQNSTDSNEDPDDECRKDLGKLQQSIIRYFWLVASAYKNLPSRSPWLKTEPCRG